MAEDMTLTYAAGAVAAKTSSDGNIRKELDRLAIAVTTAEDKIELLTQRAAPFLSPSIPAAEQTLKAATPERATFADWLAEQTDRVEKLAMRIDAVAGRIDF